MCLIERNHGMPRLYRSVGCAVEARGFVIVIVSTHTHTHTHTRTHARERIHHTLALTHRHSHIHAYTLMRCLRCPSQNECCEQLDLLVSRTGSHENVRKATPLATRSSNSAVQSPQFPLQSSEVYVEAKKAPTSFVIQARVFTISLLSSDSGAASVKHLQIRTHKTRTSNCMVYGRTL